MKKAIILNLLINLIFLKSSTSQENFTIFTIDNEKVNSEEFIRAFTKNKENKNPTAQEVEEYIELYKNFKLKVKEAYAQGLDTNPNYQSELAGYRKTLAKPYLTDQEVTEQLIEEAYNRMLQEVSASHIMVQLKEGASPEDTLVAWKKINKYYNQVKNKEIDFEELAYEKSEDPSAKINKGYLGYFTAFDMIYPFENKAYNTLVGKVSKPFRTSFGYHILYTKDKRKSLGYLSVAHIMIRYNNDNDVQDAKTRIDAVYKELQNGAEWNTLCEKYSEDFASRSQGGRIQSFLRTSRNPEDDFKTAAFALKNIGDYSEPIKSKAGWHIIKKLDLKPHGSFDDEKNALKLRVTRDMRSRKNRDAVLKRIKNENNFTSNKDVLDQFITLCTEDVLMPNAKLPEEIKENDILFTIGKTRYPLKNFARYLAAKPIPNNGSLESIIESEYIAYSDNSNLNYEESVLEEKYPDFKYLMKEYRDGILLFELMEKEIWTKAAKDSLGLENYYQAHQSDFMWEDRVDIKYAVCKDEKIAKKAAKYLQKGKETDWILDKLQKKDPLSIQIKEGTFEKKSLDILNDVEFKTGKQVTKLPNGQFVGVFVKNVLKPEPKKKEETMGALISAYQEHLEKEWLKELAKKYPITVEPNIVQRILKQFNE